MALSKTPGDDSDDRELDHYLAAGDQAPQPGEYIAETDYFSKYLKDTPSPEDAKFDPELQGTLKKLYDRQRQEAVDLLRSQITGLEQVEDYRKVSDPVLREELLEIYDSPEADAEDHRQTQSQYARFTAERDRHIREYHKAKDILAEMNEPSRQEELRHDLEGDGPKITR